MTARPKGKKYQLTSSSESEGQSAEPRPPSHPAMKCCPGCPWGLTKKTLWLEFWGLASPPPKGKEAPSPPLFQCQKKLSGEPELLQPLRSSKASWLHGASTSTWELLPGTSPPPGQGGISQSLQGPDITLSLWSKGIPSAQGVKGGWVGKLQFHPHTWHEQSGLHLSPSCMVSFKQDRRCHTKYPKCVGFS